MAQILCRQPHACNGVIRTHRATRYPKTSLGLTETAAEIERSSGMATVDVVKRESALGGKYTAVSLVGFVVDAAVLHLLMARALEPALARVASLIIAMQVTFALNRRHVFRQSKRGNL